MPDEKAGNSSPAISYRDAADLLAGAAGAGNFLNLGYVEHLTCAAAGRTSRGLRSGGSSTGAAARTAGAALNFHFVVHVRGQLRGVTGQLIGGAGSIGQRVS